MSEEFVVLALESESSDFQEFTKCSNFRGLEGTEVRDRPVKYDSIAMLEPPEANSFNLRKLLVRLKYWVLDLISPCTDEGSDMKVSIFLNQGLEFLIDILFPQLLTGY